MGAKQRYRVSEKVDAGGMAEIFRGQAISLDGIEREVAIKRVLPHLASNKKFATMFIDEARLSMRLTHGNITQVFDVGRAQDTYFLVMEFVDGANLRRIMQVAAEKGYRIPVGICTHLGIEVCKALHYAHTAVGADGKPLNIVHRDVSPPNLLVSKSGELKITDFGLAKAVSHLEITDPGVVKGKFSYLSPEACEGKEVDARADIFSLGTILHEMLTGRRLFMGKDDIETVELVRACEVPAPSLMNHDVGPELDEILQRALARDRKKRYQSAAEFGDALGDYLFSKKVRVTNFDVGRMMTFLFEEGEGSAYPRRVIEIIHEEIINLSSMGKLPGVAPTEGAKPLDMAEFRTKGTPFEDVWKEFENLPDPGELVDTKVGAETGASAESTSEAAAEGSSVRDRATLRKEGSVSGVVVPGAAKGTRKLKWGIVLLAIAMGALAGGAALWWYFYYML
jgi:serine/threonine-protein kinase